MNLLKKDDLHIHFLKNHQSNRNNPFLHFEKIFYCCCKMQKLIQVNSEVAMKSLIKQGRWEEAYELASGDETQVISMSHARSLIKTPHKAIQILVK